MSHLRPKIGFNVVSGALDVIIGTVAHQRTHTSKYLSQKTGFLKVAKDYKESLALMDSMRTITEKDIYKICDEAVLMGKDPDEAVAAFMKEEPTLMNEVQPFDSVFIKSFIEGRKELFHNREYLKSLFTVMRGEQPKINFESFKKGLDVGLSYFEKLSIQAIQKEEHLKNLPRFDRWI